MTSRVALLDRRDREGKAAAMSAPEHHELPVWGPLVLAHAGEALGGPLEVVLRLDRRMGRLVSEVSEPALGQIRLAWWREEIGRERTVDAPAPPDPLLVDILERWPGDREPLVELINGWEELLEVYPQYPHWRRINRGTMQKVA